MGRLKIKDIGLFSHVHDYFKVYLPGIKKYSPHTIRSYQKSLDLLFDYIAEKRNIQFNKITFEMIDRQTVLDFLDYLEKQRHCSLSTRNHRLHCIRAFFVYAGQQDITAVIHQKEVTEIKDCVVPEKCVSYMSMTAVEAIVKQPDTSTTMGLRDMTLMYTLYHTGCRVQEVLNIRLCDVHFGKSATMTLFGKGPKSREVPIRDVCVKHLRTYLKVFHKNVSLSSRDYLFFTEHDGVHRRMSEDNVRRFVANYGSVARLDCSEVPEKVHPHLFRHTRAMHLYQNGVDLMLVSQWLGHSKLETTLIYAQADTEHKRKAIEKAIPKESPMAEFVNPKRYTIHDTDTLKKLYGLK